MKQQVDDMFWSTMILVILLFAGILYVGHVNRSDGELIESCRRDPQCVNPFTGAGLP